VARFAEGAGVEFGERAAFAQGPFFEERADFGAPDSADVRDAPPELLAGKFALRKEAPEAARAEVEPGFEEFDGEEGFPDAHVALAEDGPTVGEVGEAFVDDFAMAGVLGVLGPGVGRAVHDVEVVAVVEGDLSGGAPEVDPAFVGKADDAGDHGEDAVVAEEAAGCKIDAGGGAFFDGFEGGFVGGVDAHEDVLQAGGMPEGEGGGVADDVCGANGGEKFYGEFAAGEFLEEGVPDGEEGGGVFVGEGDEADAAVGGEPFDFVDEGDGIAVAPFHPEAALAAIGAGVRAAAGELDDDGAAEAEAVVVVP